MKRFKPLAKLNLISFLIATMIVSVLLMSMTTTSFAQLRSGPKVGPTGLAGPYDRLRPTSPIGQGGTSTAGPEIKRVPINLQLVGPSCTDQIVDGGFETGGIPNTFWNPETSTNFGTPVCDVPSCGTGGGASPPFAGAFWTWFGGIPAPETATVGQTVTIPAGTSASLTFQMRIGTVSSPFTDVLNVRVDGAIVQSFPEPSVAEGAYTLRTINLNAFANGAAHNILFEYIGPTTGTGSYVVDDVALTTCTSAAATAGQLVISEFRVRGPNPNGAQNEFVEIYNASGAAHTVSDSGVGTGYAVVASDGVARCVIPNGTVIPDRGHYLCTNSVGYSLASNASGDATYTTDIADNAGIALFNTSVATNFVLANRLDAVGSTSEANTLYKEGTGYPALTPFSIDYSFRRDDCGKQGSITTFGNCPSNGAIVDTNNNAVDFYFVDTNGTSAGAGQRLGAPGPENLASPIQRNSLFNLVVLDSTVAAANPPNRVRDFTSDPANNSTFGTLDIRRRVVNNTGGNVTRLRFRVIDITTFPAPSGTADLRPRTSSLVVVSGLNDSATCLASNGVATTPCTVNVQGTTLETPPTQLNGGGFGSTYSAGTITLGTPLATGASINVRFLLGIQQTGSFKFFVNVEALP